MKRATLIRKIKRKFPALSLVAVGEDYGWSKGSILVGAEDGTHLLDYYSSPQIDAKLNKVIEDANWFLEWNDPGTALLFDCS